MSRRIKLIVLSILLVLLAIPIWHVGSNWAPAEPMRFRLISRERLPGLEFELDADKEAYRMEQVEIEVLNTSTAPRMLDRAQICWYSGKTNASFNRFADLVEPFLPSPVIPAGGTWRGTCKLPLPEFTPANEKNDPGYVGIEYWHASTFRRRVFTWYDWCDSLRARYFPEFLLWRSAMVDSTQSTATLEDFP